MSAIVHVMLKDKDWRRLYELGNQYQKPKPVEEMVRMIVEDWLK